MHTEEKIKIADEVMKRMSTALGVEFTPEQRQFNRGYLVAMMDAAEQGEQAEAVTICPTCGSPTDANFNTIPRK